jgi:L-fuconolactonase
MPCDQLEFRIDDARFAYTIAVPDDEREYQMHATSDAELPPFHGSMPRSTAELAAWQQGDSTPPVLEPELPIVDAHHHLFGTASDRVYYRLEDLQADLAGGHNVVATVYVEAYGAGWRTSGPPALRPVGETEMVVARCAQPLPTPRGHCEVATGIVAYADLTQGARVAEVVEAHLAAAQGRLCGIRYRTATDNGTVGQFIAEKPRVGLLREAAVREGCATLAKYDLCFDVWAYHHQLDEVIELADACPTTRLVLDHVGGVIGVAEHAARRSEVLAEWRRALRRLAQRPNVHVKIGGMGMTVFGFGFDHRGRPADAGSLAAAWQPFIDECLGAFGTARCMFESNFPVDKQSCTYVELWNALKLATRGLSTGERRDLFVGTACRTYRLDGLESRIDARQAAA